MRCHFCHKEHEPLKPCPEAKKILDYFKECSPHEVVTLQENVLRDKENEQGMKDISFMIDVDGNIIVEPCLIQTGSDDPYFQLKLTPGEFAEKVHKLQDILRLIVAAGVFGNEYDLTRY